MPTKHSEAVWNARVIGAGPFPLDMLRYDACVPRNESDTAVIANSVAHGKFSVRHSVYVQGRGPLGPTTARWASFGWQVVYADATLQVIVNDERQERYVAQYLAHETPGYDVDAGCCECQKPDGIVDDTCECDCR